MNDVTRFAILPANAIEAAAYDATPLADALEDAGYSRAAEAVRWLTSEIEALEAEIKTLEDEELKGENRTLERENEDLKDENRTLERENEDLKDENRTLKGARA